MILFEDSKLGLVVTASVAHYYISVSERSVHKSTRTWAESIAPKNSYQITQAKRACELGLDVQVPEPEYSEEVVNLTEEEINDIIETLWEGCWFSDDDSSFIFRDPEVEEDRPDIKFTDTGFSWCSSPGLRTHVSVSGGMDSQSPTQETLKLLPEKTRKQVKIFMTASEELVRLEREEREEKELRELKRMFDL